MEELNKDFSPEESLQLIQHMIGKAKGNYANNSIYFLLWGWFVFGICILQFILLAVFKYQHSYYVWALIWIPLIITIVIVIKRRHVSKVSTYIGDSMKFLWQGIGITFFVVGFICSVNGWEDAFSLYIMLYGTGTYITGALIRFRILMIAGIACWVISIITAFLPYEWQILVTAFALLISYIIPGHMLQSNYKKTLSGVPDHEGI
jgi:hypothetical protein